MKKHITWTISDVDKSFQLEGIIKYLVGQDIDLSFILINMQGSAMDTFITSLRKPALHLKVSGYHNFPMAILKSIRHFNSHHTRVVHCHLLKANLIGLLAAWFLRVPMRIYTRHHSTYHHLYSKKGVILDRLINWLSTGIVAISEVTKRVLKDGEGVPVHKIHLISHGFDFQIMEKLALHTWEAKFQKAQPVIGVVSRFIEWKGIQFIIPAFQKLLSDYPDALLLIVGGSGPYQSQLKDQLSHLPSGSYEIREFENNIFPIFKSMDIFVHVPVSKDIEAFGQIYVEALAMGLPSVFTLSGIANEFVKHGENALVVDYQNVEEIYEAVKILLNDHSLAEKFGRIGSEAVKRLFTVDQQASKLIKLYC